MLLPQEYKRLIMVTKYISETGPSVDWIVLFPELPAPKESIAHAKYSINICRMND